jgi:hypothetical protein
MEFLPKKLVREWSWRVDTGMPNWTNPLHLVELKNLLIERRFPYQFIDGLLSNLTEEKLVPNPNPSPNAKKKMVTLAYAKTFYKDKGIDVDNMSDDEVASMAQGDSESKIHKKADDEPKAYKMSDEEKARMKELEEKEGRREKRKWKGGKTINKKEQKELAELRSKRDHEKADEALHMSQTEYDKLKARHKFLKKWKSIQNKINKDKKLSKKDKNFIKRNKLEDKTFTEKELKEFNKLEEGGIGAGQEKSQAGEAITHKALRMRKEGKSWKQIEDYLNSVVSDSDHVLYKKTGKPGDGWVAAGIAVAKRIENEFGMDAIETISWDTPEGRKAIGVDPDFNTASDMFVLVRDKEGKIKKVGISLKKDGAVFVNNGGWSTQHDIFSPSKKYRNLLMRVE